MSTGDPARRVRQRVDWSGRAGAAVQGRVSKSLLWCFHSQGVEGHQDRAVRFRLRGLGSHSRIHHATHEAIPGWAGSREAGETKARNLAENAT